MTSRPPLTDLPFLAATLAMVLALVLPWAFGRHAGDGQQVAEVGSVLPWAVPEPMADSPQLPDPAVQLAGQAGAAPEDVAQP